MKKLLILVPCFMAVLALSKACFAQITDTVADIAAVEVKALSEVASPPAACHPAYPAYPVYPSVPARLPLLAHCPLSAPQYAPTLPCPAPSGCTCGCAAPPVGCPYGCLAPAPKPRMRFAERRAERRALAAMQAPAPYQFPTPYPFPAVAPPDAVPPAPTAAFAPQGYYPPSPVTTTTAGRNALQRSMAPIVINFMSILRSPRNQYDPYAGYYQPQYPQYPYPQAYPGLPVQR